MTPTPDQIEKLRQSTHLARDIDAMFKEKTDDMRVAFMASLIYAGSSAHAMGMPLHDALSALMSIYKDAEKFTKANNEK